MVDDELALRLRGSGFRLTPQRRLILDAVTRLVHATPEEVAGEVRELGINTSTVYRNLEVLENLGLVKHTHLVDRAPTYHVVGDHEHVHLVCRECQNVRSVDPSVVSDLVTRLHDEQGFVVDVGHLAIFGHCVSCQETAEDTSHDHAHHGAGGTA